MLTRLLRQQPSPARSPSPGPQPPANPKPSLLLLLLLVNIHLHHFLYSVIWLPCFAGDAVNFHNVGPPQTCDCALARKQGLCLGTRLFCLTSCPMSSIKFGVLCQHGTVMMQGREPRQWQSASCSRPSCPSTSPQRSRVQRPRQKSAAPMSQRLPHL